MPQWAKWVPARRPRRANQPDQDMHSSSRLQCVEAVLDVVATLPLSADELYIDTTIRNPLAEKYLRGAGQRSSSTGDGYACEVADNDKLDRYPPTQGIVSTPASAEVFGRLSPTFVQLLADLSSAASRRDSARALPPLVWQRRWLMRFSTGLQRCVAQYCIDGLGVASAWECMEVE